MKAGLTRNLHKYNSGSADTAECVSGLTIQMNNLHIERQYTPLQTSKGLSAKDSKTGDKQSAYSIDQQWLSHILQHESNSSSAPELHTGSSQAFLWQPYKTMPAEGAKSGLCTDSWTSEPCFTLSSCDLRLHFSDISRRFIPKDCVSNNCMHTSELLSKHGRKGENLKKKNSRGYFYF